jgi:hypothetical protein
MAFTIATPADLTPLDLETYVELVARGYDLRDADAVIASAPLLRRLALDRTFMLRYVNEHLRDVMKAERGNPYSVQSFVLAVHEKFVVRANVWVKPRDYGAGEDWESRAFVYGAAHNHNFDFLTVGYYGAGYWTDVYELEGEPHGYPGESVRLRFLENTSLPQGKVMYFRKFKDVHVQLPPKDDLAISLNLMVTDVDAFRKEQYEFDIARSRVVGAVNRVAVAHRNMFEIAALIGDASSQVIVADIAERHPNPRTRAHAQTALSRLEGRGK